MDREAIRICDVCGNVYDADYADYGCPLCKLRKDLGKE